jgi:hypothetical protein
MLTYSEMGVDGSISRSACQVFSVSVRNMLTSLWISEPLSQAEINNVNVVLLFANSDKEIVWLNISMQEVP